jgi:hypothetical protein
MCRLHGRCGVSLVGAISPATFRDSCSRTTPLRLAFVQTVAEIHPGRSALIRAHGGLPGLEPIVA